MKAPHYRSGDCLWRLCGLLRVKYSVWRGCAVLIAIKASGHSHLILSLACRLLCWLFDLVDCFAVDVAFCFADCFCLFDLCLCRILVVGFCYCPSGRSFFGDWVCPSELFASWGSLFWRWDHCCPYGCFPLWAPRSWWWYSESREVVLRLLCQFSTIDLGFVFGIPPPVAVLDTWLGGVVLFCVPFTIGFVLLS